MKQITVKLDDEGQDVLVTETVNLDGSPRIDVSMRNHNARIGHGIVTVELLDLSRREAERVAKAILRSVATSRRKHQPRKGWP